VLKIILRLGNIKLSMRLNKLTGLVLLCLAFFSSGLVAQDFSAENSKYTPAIYGDKFTYEEDKFYYFNELAGVLFLEGSIEKGMYKDFRQAITDNKIHTLVLDSPGGNVSEGLQIAGTVFDRKIKTYIRKNQNCASACSFIFLSGKTRYTLGKLGVHQIAFDEEFSKKKKEVGLIGEVIQITNSDIVQYLDENNTPGFVYKYMLRTPPNEMYYFNEDELNQLGNSEISSQDKLHFNRIDNFTKDYNSHIIKQKCDTDPNSCTTTQLCARAAKNNAWRTSIDAAKFVKLAKSMGKRCGVPIPVCPEDIKKCNQEYLCTYGTTGLDASLSWLNNSFADEAKMRGYNCGIIIKPVVKNKTCSSDPTLCNDKKCSELASKCSNKRLCNYASFYYSTSARDWNKNPSWATHVSEAKSRGLSCGVVKNIQEQKNGITKEIQTYLNMLGCSAGIADGVIGPKTLSALERWKISGGNYIKDKIDRQLSIALSQSSFRCSPAKNSNINVVNPEELSGTWKIRQSRCNKYDGLLYLYSPKSNQYEARYDVLNTIFEGKLKIVGDKYSIILKGANETILANGNIDKTYWNAQFRDQNGCRFEFIKRTKKPSILDDMPSYFKLNNMQRKDFEGRWQLEGCKIKTRILIDYYGKITSTNKSSSIIEGAISRNTTKHGASFSINYKDIYIGGNIYVSDDKKIIKIEHDMNKINGRPCTLYGKRYL